MRRTLVFLFVGFAALIPISSNVYLPKTYGIALFKMRPILAGALVLVGMFLIVVWRGRILAPNQRTVFVLSLLVPCYLLVLSIVRTIPLDVIALYTLWALFSFALAPLLLRDHLPSLAKWLTLTYAGIVLLSAYYARGPVPAGLPRPPTMGYLNENYYGQILQMFVCAWMLWRASQGKNLVLIGIVAIPISIYLGLIQARSVVVFMLVLGGSYLYLTRGRTWLGKALLPLVLAASLVGVFAYAGDYRASSADVSSGRFGIWTRALATMDDETTLAGLSWATGAPSRDVQGGLPYNPLREEALFANPHVDNMYLEIILLGGITGLILFLLPYFVILAKAWPRTQLTSVALAILAGAAVQSAVSSTVPTFGSPAGFLFGLVSSLPMLAAQHSLQPSQVSIEGSRQVTDSSKTTGHVLERESPPLTI